MAHIQEARVAQKPAPVIESIPSLLLEHWGLQLQVESLKALDSYDDANFYLVATSQTEPDVSRQFLLKFYNTMETRNPAFLEGLSMALGLLSDSKSPLYPIKVPTIQPVSKGSATDYVFVPCQTVSGVADTAAVRVFHWISGDTLNSFALTVEATTFFQVGHAVGRLQSTFQQVNFDHPALHREHLWDLRQFPVAATAFLPSISDHPIIHSTITCLQTLYTETFVNETSTLNLPCGIIMGDANDANIIVAHSELNHFHVAGIIDFSDIMYSWRVNELAIACAYGLVTHFPHVPKLWVLASLFLGYLGVGVESEGYTYATSLRLSLTDDELNVFSLLLATRLATSVLVGAYSLARSSDALRAYLSLHAQPARTALTSWCHADAVVAETDISIDNVRQRLQHHTRFFQRLYHLAQQHLSDKHTTSRDQEESVSSSWKAEVQRLVDEFSA